MMKHIRKSCLFAIACTAMMSTVSTSQAKAASLDLRGAGLQSGTLNTAIFQEIDPTDPAGTGVLNSFVRLQSPGNSTVEEGYNTDGRPLQFDENNSPVFTRSLQLSDVPIFTIAGVDYRQFVLDLNEPNEGRRGTPEIDLEELQIFLGTAGNLLNYPTFNGNATQIFDLDGNGENTVNLIDSNAGSGRSDLLVYIPNSLFTGAGQYVYLYSKFTGAEGGFEEWAVQKVDTPPKPVPEPATLTGLGLLAGAMAFIRRRKSDQTA